MENADINTSWEYSTLDKDPENRDNEEYEYYVNVILFGATVACYIVLLLLFTYFGWKLLRVVVKHVRAMWVSGVSASDVPYKDMYSSADKLASVTVVPVKMNATEPGHMNTYQEWTEPRNPFRGPLHTRAEAASSVPAV